MFILALFMPPQLKEHPKIRVFYPSKTGHHHRATLCSRKQYKHMLSAHKIQPISFENFNSPPHIFSTENEAFKSVCLKLLEAGYDGLPCTNVPAEVPAWLRSHGAIIIADNSRISLHNVGTTEPYLHPSSDLSAVAIVDDDGNPVDADAEFIARCAERETREWPTPGTPGPRPAPFTTAADYRPRHRTDEERAGHAARKSENVTLLADYMATRDVKKAEREAGKLAKQAASLTYCGLAPISEETLAAHEAEWEARIAADEHQRWTRSWRGRKNLIRLGPADMTDAEIEAAIAALSTPKTTESSTMRSANVRRLHLVEAAPPARKMQIEWFNDAAGAAMEKSPDPLIEDLLDSGAMSVVYGDSNAGKTFVALDQAFCVSTGMPWNGKATKRGLVVYVAAEGGTRIRKELAALKKHYGDTPAPLFALVRFPIDLRSSDANLKELLELIRGAEEETGEKCVWIIVDTLSRALAGGDENSPVDMGRVVLAADKIRDETKAHFSYIHHTGKDAARGARGHSLLRAATDTEIEVTPDKVAVTKQRDMEGDFSISFALRDVQIGTDMEGNPIKSAVVDWSGEAANEVSIPRLHLTPATRAYVQAVAVLQNEAAPLRVYPDGPMLKVLDRERVRTEFYASFAADNQAAKRQAFNRGETKAKENGLINFRQVGDLTWIWLTATDEQMFAMRH